MVHAKRDHPIMAEAEPGASDRWYVRARGQVLGPLSWSQLQTLRDRGQLARFHTVSQDRQNWVSAASLVQLFPGDRGRGSGGLSGASAGGAGPDDFIVMELDESDSPPSHRGPSTADEESTAWFFARDGAQQGPSRLAELRRLAAAGEIGPETLFWRTGLADWTPGFLIPELAFLAPGDPDATAHPNAPGSSTTIQMIPSPRTSLTAFASLAMGVLWICGAGSLAAMVLSVLALRRISRSKGTLTGTGMAIAGMALGLLGLAIAALVGVWLVGKM
jgi:hypothetical protein